MVGGQRRKNPDARRTSLKATEEPEETEDSTLSEHQEQLNEEMERARRKSLQEKQLQDMQAHTASRQPDISRNAGNNVKQQHITQSTQPRSMNH
ncbi:hypothetical protein K501DRAFT_200816 [Backusella circina FSU 941]|nr:hypothetical protein K501DRAFT_200816 [Backusella circina FSU 941]